MMDSYAPATLPAKGSRWSTEEEATLVAAFTSGTPIAELAHQHGRSIGAITSRLQQLDVLTYPPYTALIAKPTRTEAKPQAESDTEGEKQPLFKPWTEEEVAQLLTTHHSIGTPESLCELAPLLNRTPRALAMKLVSLGVVKEAINPNPIPQPKPEKAKAREANRNLARRSPPLASGGVGGQAAKIKITVTPEFQTALASIQAGENLLILGSAGTGKSTFLKWLRHQMKDKNHAVLAPTGMAALQVGGQTIHSFFGLKPQLLDGTSSSWHKPRNPKIYQNLKFIVIDEISMVRADVFSAIDGFLRRNGPTPRQPFGGVQLVLMGDLCQLPPIVRRDEAEVFSTTYETPFFFSSPSYAQGNFGIVEFTHIFRQTDEPFIALLNHIRHGHTNHHILAELNQRLTTATPNGAVILASRNRTVDDINQQNLAALAGHSHTYRAILSGNADPAAFTTPAELTLKVGARVMFTRNDSLQRWVNGTLGTVLACEDEAVSVRTDATATTPAATHVVEPVKWEATKYQFDEATQSVASTVAGSFTQLPLTLAWALTIHKAQGQTLENCVLNLADGGTFAEGQLYVALSRA
ncbi:MAG: hypothetical protein EBR79_02845, partial [Proteobacteria bacterium]|nr:hypothetical protein [Pseudomonadota bacterium]